MYMILILYPSSPLTTIIAFHKWISARRCPRNHCAWFTPPDHQGDVQRPFSYVGWRTTHAHSPQRQKEGQSDSGWYRPPVSFLSSSITMVMLLILFSIAIAPPFAGLRRFPDGRGFKQWTGDDSKALMKVSRSPFIPTHDLKLIRLYISFTCLPCRVIFPVMSYEHSGPFSSSATLHAVTLLLKMTWMDYRARCCAFIHFERFLGQYVA